jgi:UDP-3-O-[3-hydroxymyristoyl] N-acetylglucosamine deacetylase
MLDAIGDLALIGHPVIGHVVAHRAGHALHTAFATKVLQERDAWRIVEAPEIEPLPVPLPVGAKRPVIAN